MNEVALAFLEGVQDEQPRGWMCVSQKDWAGGGWSDELHEDLEQVELSDDDLYFAPNVFSEPRRRQELVLPSRFLYADLDEVDPRGVDPEPTLAWETSPDRFQCMWRLNRHLSPRAHRKLNSRLTYFVGADKGGWGLTKVLRIPHTKSNKYEEPFRVRLMWDEGKTYKPERIAAIVRNVALPASASDVPMELPDVTARQVLRKHYKRLPGRARKLLKARDVSGHDRSARLWELEGLLLSAGLSPEETFIVVRASAWNKYRGQRRETKQLWTEITKHLDDGKADKPKKAKKEKLPAKDRRAVSYRDFRAKPISAPGWMVEGIWSENAYGLIAGQSKAYKSLLALELSVSVASGTPFLGHFPVPETGPVLVIQEENSAGMVQDRVMKITHARGLDGHASLNGSRLRYQAPEDLPMQFLNNDGFNLKSDDDLEWLEDRVRRDKLKLVVLDPLYQMIPGADENSASDMVPILKNLMRFKHEYGVGFLVVHHYRKENPMSPIMVRRGEKMSGTGVFYRWFESAVYVEAGEEEGSVIMVPEHRGHPPQGIIHVDIAMGEAGDLDYHLEVNQKKEERKQLFSRLREAVEADPGLPLTDLSEQLGITRDRARRLCERAGFRLSRGARGRGTGGRPGLCVYVAKGNR